MKTLLEAAEKMLKQRTLESLLFSGRIGKQTNMEKLGWFTRKLVVEHLQRRIGPTSH